MKANHRVGTLLQIGARLIERDHRGDVFVVPFANELAAKRRHRRPFRRQRERSQERAERAFGLGYAHISVRRREAMDERLGGCLNVTLPQPRVRAEAESGHDYEDRSDHPSLDNLADAILGSPMHVDKRSLIHELRAVISRESAVLAAAAKDARAAATHEEAKPENDKDTRAIEAAYLAGAQAERVRELDRVANSLEFLALRDFDDNDSVALTAIVTLAHEGVRTYYFISPVAGGMRARMGDVEVQVITPQSPMGQALVGRTVGDVVDVRKREYEIVSVR